MASLQRRSSGLYLLSFRFQGRQYQRSLETCEPDEAARIKLNIERRIDLLSDGTLRLPEGASPSDLWMLLVNGRIQEPAVKLIRETSLTTAASQYLKSYPTGSKEQDTLKTESVHLNNFCRILGQSTLLHTLGVSDLLRYVQTRMLEKGNRGGTIKADTVRKELQTFQLVWRFARQNHQVFANCPAEELRKPKRRQKPPFQTWEQIQEAIARGDNSKEQISEFWERLFLRESEIAEFLEHVKKCAKTTARFAYIYAALSFCAYTGARRSEMFRCQVVDVSQGRLLLREKKKNTEIKVTYRFVPIHVELGRILDDWMVQHPGGAFLFCKNRSQPLDDRTAREAFAAVTRNCRWSVEVDPKNWTA